MTPEEQRIAIAEACGWKSVDRKKWGGYTDTYQPLCSPADRVDAPAKFWGYIPDYLNDLNAMHEAEKTLHGNRWRPYHDKLAIITMSGPWPAIDATADQRAEAFLRTIGKWVEAPAGKTS